MGKIIEIKLLFLTFLRLVLTVNGTSGEGMSLSVDERKQTAERWQKVSEELKITTMIQIGGAAFADVIELVKITLNMPQFTENTRHNFTGNPC